MENGNLSQSAANDPSNFLSEIIGSSVTVKLNSGIIYKGELVAIDGYMNISLEKCEEIVEDSKKHYGDAFVRGNNVMYISAD
ncbi:U6 snRNA-associated Sm-like protein LSm6 [Golovinomyces cichoracearum]|uniref:U6 snRNA-associated Sm-like protein LSm6 n=1 Tax=Golovinomyces cichoracearum TaxID=62708 RepID=A0A420IDQ4_9PEZI|nr:U6 snRNA-associated Sm-like protein LSm6 [Golovinomyces cichoracearum]